MDPRKLMERLKGAAALTEQDVGEFSHFKGKMMKISIHSYAVEDWGSLSLLESRGMAGLMRRDMLVINSCVKDIPVLVIQYMALFGRRMLQVHVLEVMKDKTAAGRFASLGRMAEQSGTAVQETPVEWYTPMQLPGSVTVTGKSSQLAQLAGDVAVGYLAAAAQVRQTGAVEGRYLRLRKLMSQRVCLQQQNTEDLYSRWLFGLGEAPVSGSGEQSDAAAAPAQTSDEEKNTPQEPETTSEGSEAPEENG